MTKRKAKPELGEYRGIYVALLNSPEFLALSAEARACFWPLKLLLGRAGIAVLHSPAAALSLYAALPEEDCAAALAELEDAKWVVKEGVVYWLRNGLRFDPADPLKSPNQRKGIEAHLKTLPKLAIVNRFARYYNLPIPYPDLTNPTPPDSKGSTKGFRKGSAKGSERVTETPTVARKTEDGLRNTDTDDGVVPATLPSSSSSDIPVQADVARDDDNNGHSSEADHARKAMTEIVDEYALSLETSAATRSFTALAEGIVDGSDYAVWQDTTGTQIPHKERPRLLKLAVSHCKANPRQSLRSALKYVALQQLSPFPAPTSNEPPEGSQAAEVRKQGMGANYRQDNSVKRTAPNPTPIAGGGPKPIDDAEMVKWEAENPEAAAEIKARIEDEFKADPQWQGKHDSPLARLALKARFKKYVADRIRAERPDDDDDTNEKVGAA